MTRLTGPNQISTEWTYDRWGRQVGERRADGTATTWTRQWARDCAAPHPQAVWCLRVQADGAGRANTQFDTLGRQVRAVTTGFDGRYAQVDKDYDAQGRQSRVSQPYYEGEPVHWTETRYDALDRVVEVTTEGPAGQPVRVQTAYDGLVTTVTRPRGERKTSTVDVLGRVIEVTEPLGAAVTYTYDALGNLLQTRDPQGHITELSYDQRGHKVAMDDPAMGRWDYAYNAAGELTWQRDARGRRVQRREAEGTSQWQYDTAAKGIGKIAQVTGAGLTRSQTYDRLGRPVETRTQIGAKTLSERREYDALGRVQALHYPMGFTVEHDFNAQGYLLAVKSPRGLIQDHRRRHIQGLLGDVLTRIEAAQQKASDYQAEASRYRTKAQQYQRSLNTYRTRAATQRQQAASLQRAAEGNAAEAARQTRAGAIDRAAAEAETAQVAEINNSAATLRASARANRASAAAARDQAHTLGTQATATERQASIDRAAAYQHYSTARQDGAVASQLRAAAARLTAIADELDAEASYWQNQADSRYANLQRIGGGVRCFNLWGSRFCYDFGEVMQQAVATATDEARTRISQAQGYRRQAATQQALAQQRASAASGHWQSGAALLRQSASDSRRAAVMRDQADRLRDQATGQQRSAYWQDRRAGYLERAAAPTNQRAAQLQAQARQHDAQAQSARSRADQQRAQARQKQAAAVPLDQRAREYLAQVNRELGKAEIALARAERYAQDRRELEKVAEHYQALLGDDEYAVFWRAKDRDAAGRLRAVVHGNGLTTHWHYNQATGTLDRIATGLLWENLRELDYQYDDHSNVIRRSDRTNDVEETFQYDRLDRLSLARVSSHTDPTEAYNHSTTYRYDLSGNITHKSDLGSYQYDQPYRLASAGSRHQNYRYDANGNVTSGGGRRFIWSSFNKPTRMSQGGATTSFSYGPERHRYRRIDQLEGQTTTRLYLGKRYEQISTGDRTTHKYFIYAGDQLAAIHFDEVDHRGDQSDYQTRYLHTDALGSVDLITDGAGGVVDKLSFDPSGQRRTATWRSVQQRLGQASLAPLLTNRGFTGHEHVDALGIIHMNGRIYDPELGRFLSADPTMQHPYSTQGQNRYAYVQNNPLKYVDMSGFGFFPKIFKGIGRFIRKYWRPIVAVVVAVVTYGTVSKWAIAWATSAGYGATAASVIGGVVGGAAAGFAAGGITTGTLKGALQGAVSGAIMGGIGGYYGETWNGARVAANGVGGGLSSRISGGSFKDGFAGAFFTAAVNPLIKNSWLIEIKGALRTLAGGTASRLGGGKFANGATSAAMGFLFKGGLHDAQEGKTLSAQDAKAVDALNAANPQSIKDNLEYGGYIYKNADGTYGYTSPLKGTDQGFNPSSALSFVPKGASIVGDYHTHADYSLVDATGAAIRTSDPLRDAFNSDNFSSTDYRGIAADAGSNAAYRGYLGVPSGSFRAYDPVGDREYVIKP